MVFQNPLACFDPLRRVGEQVERPLRLHTRMNAAQRHARALEALAQAGLLGARQLVRRYPHELSGGQLQRVMIASALALRPDVLIADEPTTALDVATQAQVVALLRECARDLAMLFVSHDLGVVSRLADRLVVLRAGVVVEAGEVAQVLRSPRHSYTQSLIAATPDLTPVRKDAPAPGAPAVLLARGLAKTYRARRLWRAEAAVGALAEVDLHVGPGETLGILGESGSGKSTLACCIARLQGLDKGELSLDGNDVRRLDAPALGGRVQMIFQDPQRALNPRSKVGESLIECALNLGVARGVAVRRAQALLHQVGLPAAAMERYPHAFSGGQSQRLCIARALVSRPRLLIADEAVSALGMSVQAQVLELLERVQQEHGLSMIFITHDLLAAARICHRFVVMQAGRVVEQGPVAEVYARPGHRYTQALLQATGALA